MIYTYHFESIISQKNARKKYKDCPFDKIYKF